MEAEIAEPLTILFDKSIKKGVVPFDWKVANIVPVFKKGDRTDPGSCLTNLFEFNEDVSSRFDSDI